MHQGVEAMQGLPRVQRPSSPLNVPQAERYDQARVFAVVSYALDQANAEQGREHVVAEKWFDRELQVCSTARQTDRGLQIELVVSYLRLDSCGSA